MQRGTGKPQARLRTAMLTLLLTTLTGKAYAQSIDCYDRALVIPRVVTPSSADSCHRKVIEENTTNDRHAIALYNAGRLYIVLGDQAQDKAAKIAAYDKATADILESRDRAADNNSAFLKPWRKGDKRSQEAQIAANRFFVANRTFQLAKAYLELGRLDGGRACPSRDGCLERAAAELENDAAAQTAGTFRDDFIYLRATAYLEWGQTAPARRDLEFLKSSAIYGPAAAQKLGDMLLADAQRQLGPPVTTAGIMSARVSYKAAAAIPAVAVAGQLGLAGTYLLEAQGAPDLSERRARFLDAAREFGLALSMTNSPAAAADELEAYKGRGTALYQLGRLGDASSMNLAIEDLQKAAALEFSLGGGKAQLMLARALAEAGREVEADAAYAEAERRFGQDPEATSARAERAFSQGKQLYADGNDPGARLAFQRALKETAWSDGRADAFYFLSAIDLRAGQNAIENADAATLAGGGSSPYREQACLARISAGGSPVKKKTALPACAGNDLLLGMFYLRHAQLAPTASSASESRRQAQDAFLRARTSNDVLRTSPISEVFRVSDLATFGSAVALGCSSTAGLNVPVDLDAAKLEQAKTFFRLHHVHACISAD